MSFGYFLAGGYGLRRYYFWGRVAVVYTTGCDGFFTAGGSFVFNSDYFCTNKIY